MGNINILENIKKNYEEKEETVEVSLSGGVINELSLPDGCAVMFLTNDNRVIIESEAEFYIRISSAKKLLGYSIKDRLNSLPVKEREQIFKYANYKELIGYLGTEQKIEGAIEAVKTIDNYGELIDRLISVLQQNHELSFTKSSK